MYDIVFISYKELNAEINWKSLDNRFAGRTKRLHGISGIHNAHYIAANMVRTPMFYVVDGDAEILEDFHFDYPVEVSNIVHVFRAQNPVNDLVYGYGAVKLMPRNNVLVMDFNNIKPDMTSSLPTTGYNVVNVKSNITRFDTDPFNTWRAAFRECAKLSSKVIDNQKDHETVARLTTWCTVGLTRMFGDYAIKGASSGRAYGEQNKDNLENLMHINDYRWLQHMFTKDFP
jgi:hypothetical protein